MDEEKYRVIVETLRKAFKGKVIEEPIANNSRELWVFKVPAVKGRSYRVAFSKNFIDDHTAEQIVAGIENRRLIDAVRDNPAKVVMLSNDGVQVVEGA